MNDLVFALKIRFLHLLEREEQVQQVGLMIEACESELARIEGVKTNIPFIERILGHADFLDLRIDTGIAQRVLSTQP